ncbi:uncharacterized protein M421DRAFT_420204 [Didymella exigua CBS 183.55]|uniref:Uncharacterized protein n=1 Tax=Didymella exigua CBS 183.55 TaxID=1150837 RepID=A0A6A5RNF4_9PLEO|nr:uncharacterized protein M421DRAFT_420204 [Didymella exigua CBS 183.55]KAF1928973.1 hypothetical protein M421DRAFT_420204 [Didymella exigua CBS 183.55]
MALNGSTRRSSDIWHDNKPMHDSFDVWVSKNGKDAYKDFKKAHPTTKHSYDSWRQTEQVYGPYLFYVTSMIWHEDDNSDDGSTKRRRISRVPDENPKKTATVNGNGAPRTAGSATPTPAANSDEVNASGKRKRKPRKKYMSQELVASDEEPTDEVEAATLIIKEETITAPAVTINGRRKSASRKPRKKPISDETVLSEDENDDRTMIDAQPIASPLPVRSAPRAAATARQSESPKKATPKQAYVKKSRKSFLVRLPFHLWDAVNLEEKSEEMVLDEDTDHGEVSIAEVIRPATTPATTPKPDTSNDIQTDTNADEAAEPEEEGTPDTSAANTRRGLRNRKPAQQRPYYHDAQVFEDVETEEEDDSELEAVSREGSPEALSSSRPKHFKGKGRAWKKDGSDEDEEFVTPKEKKATKAAKAKAHREKAKAEKEESEQLSWDITLALWQALVSDADWSADRDNPNHISNRCKQEQQANGSAKDISQDIPEETSKEMPKQKKNLGRPKKSLSEDTVRDDSDNDTPQATPSQPFKRGRGRPRKSALSSEIVHDDSEDEAPAVTKQTSPPAQKATSPEGTSDLITPPKTKPTTRPFTAKSTAEAITPKKRGRPRKSSAATTPAKSASKSAKDADHYEPQRCGSAATDTTEPKISRARASVSSASDDFPMPNVNRGAALIESLYPRDQHEPSRASPAPTPAPEPVCRAPPAPPMVAAPKPVETAQASVEPQPSVEEMMEDEDTAPAISESKPEAFFEAVVEDDEGNMSAAMSLSSDGGL